MTNQIVSIVITTKNEEKNIGNCLQSISEQTYDHVEVIVVDNGSTDRTKEISRQYTNLVFDKGPERSAQRNYGMIEIAKGEYVMFVDADMILAPCLVERCVAKIMQSGCLALHISEVILGKTFWSKVRRFERSFYDGTVIDGARFFRKDVFINVKGFDENMSGPEDWDIDKKIKQSGEIHLLNQSPGNKCAHKEWSLLRFIEDRGIDVSILKDVIYHNESEFELKSYISKKRYYADSFDAYIQKWGKNDPDVRLQLGVEYRFFGIFFGSGNWLKLLSHPLLTIGMYMLRCMVGVMFIAVRFHSND